MTIRDNRDCIRVLLYSYYTTITGWGVLLMYQRQGLEGHPERSPRNPTSYWKIEAHEKMKSGLLGPSGTYWGGSES